MRAPKPARMRIEIGGRQEFARVIPVDGAAIASAGFSSAQLRIVLDAIELAYDAGVEDGNLKSLSDEGET